ncbi:hypothetical protein A2954_01265 [Candidatus Roizmanbacteria bacterium RIFCSPLOWO2_01_FULL_37_12]|uniref:Glycosyltransferase RgtA/B/C/D-like domain-containing protein n=1 Tax=Candidatus Roizmanbacteria bacterium RIFCSPLOWO2_01_FULL_37_12 TaxID=1802056 RepID=A0A1F7IGH0_9BACT|nr:MAG: hypothetical protein A3D76_06025 [Candidatus Roizmanbacteria bacterium RIFCSPHIGHO2_02_FULL_37_9b]OGK42454.1 MAG: hypothetical protein A2954_01265 [Candidatus Roizmanbacteria bacterium RIFCSPLOWO2_01_FULL_37_12]
MKIENFKLKIFLKEKLFIIIFISFLLSLIFLTYKDYGIPWDEKVFFSTGKFFVVKLLNFLQIPTNLSTVGFEPTPHHLKGHGVFMDMLSVGAGMLFPLFNFEVLHLIRALFAAPIFILVYWIVSQLISKVYGLIAVVLLLTFPRFYPEIYYNAVDIPTALLFTICLSYFIYYLKTEKTVFKSIIFGLILGVTINQRLLLFYLPIVNFIFLFFQKKTRREFLFHQSLTLISLLLSMHLTHPYLLSRPITGLFDIIKNAKQYPWNAAVLFEGQFYQAGVKPLPWYYLPKTILITSPIITLILFLFGSLKTITILGRSIQDGIKQQTQKNLIFFYVLALFITPFILVLILKPTLYDSWRQFLFLTIPNVILAAEGLHLLLADKKLMISNYKNIPDYLLDKKNWGLRLFGKGIVGMVVLSSMFYTAVQMIRLHPYEYLYYNSLTGGLKGTYGKYETDYWGLGYKEAVVWFNKNVNKLDESYKIFVEGDPLSSSYYFKPNMSLTTDPLTADYIFTFTRWNFHTRHQGKTIYTVEKEGVPLIFVKQL